MQFDPIAVRIAHPTDGLAAPHPLALAHQHFLLVGIGRQQRLVVLNRLLMMMSLP